MEKTLNKPNNPAFRVFHKIRMLSEIAGLVALLLAVSNVSAQIITNAYDAGANYAAAGNFFTGDNQGFGFGAWSLSLGGGGQYLPKNDSAQYGNYAFTITNMTASGLTTANRPFSSPLAVGASFSLRMQLNNLDGLGNTNGFSLQDASGTVLFKFYHQGGDNLNGHFTDAKGNGTATNFQYNFTGFTSLTFTLNNSTNYTFKDDTTGASFSGTLSGVAITQVTFFRANGSTAPSNGQNFGFNTLMITSLGNKPLFTVQPKNQWGFAGGAITLNALATSSQPLAYQWYFTNAPLAGATSTNLVLGNLGFTNAGSYFVIASNALGSATSAVAVVNILPFGYTNACDVAANYSGFSGNLGYGFGPWVLSTPGGGSYLGGSTQVFSIWNGAATSQSTAVRTFKTPLAVGGTFLVRLRLNSLDTADCQNGFDLQDSNKNVVFRYWHQGGDSLNGHFNDANGTGTATGFAYDAGQLDSFAFVLNSATSYTFSDLTTGVKFSGTLSGAAISQVTFRRANLGAAPTSNGQDFQFDNLVLLSPNAVAVPVGTPTLSPYGFGAVGGTVSLTATAFGTPTINYQWYYGNLFTPIAGATNATLILTNVQAIHNLGNEGDYFVSAQNVQGAPLMSTSAVSVMIIPALSPIKIMPLGDSITDGVGAPGGYRAPLYQSLVNAHFNVNYVGTQTDNSVSWLPDADHEGHPGWRIDQILSNFLTWVNAVPSPDIILLLIGTNDYGQNYDPTHAINRLDQLIGLIATNRPNAKLLVANLTLRSDTSLENQIATTFNPFVPGLVASHAALGQHVYFVDLHSALVAADFFDGVHPNQTGYNKMAAAWAKAITSIVPPPGSTNATVYLTNANSTLTYLGVPRFQYITQRSTNLSLGGWVAISTNTVPSNGVLQVVDGFSDLGGAMQNTAFYRLFEQ